MIQTDFSWTEPFNLLLMLAALVLLAVQCGLVYARHRASGRLGVRLGLNLLLWLSIVAWILNPYFKSDGKSHTAMLIAKNLPSNAVSKLRDSLARAEVIGADEIGRSQIDTLVIAGQEVDSSVFAAIRQSKYAPVVQWVPYFAADELRDLQWKGVVQKGALQRIEGSIRSTQKQLLQVRYEGRTLDSVKLNSGENAFRLTFPAFSEGRTTTTLQLNGRVIDTLRFFTQPEEKLTVRFLLKNPDFETRNLANWLGKSGHAVLYDATLSKNIQGRLNINRASEPDLVVTTPENASNAAVKKAINSGKSVIFLQLTDPLAELRHINQALGTRFQAVKVFNEESIALSPALTAQPFRFEKQNFQMHASNYPAVVEKTTGKIGVSLLNETFPMQLSGDSVAYGKVWSEILAWVRPAEGPEISWEAPVFRNVPLTLHWNGSRSAPGLLEVGRDTVFTNISPLNEHSATAALLPAQAGWHALHDSLGTELYVQDYSPLRYAAQMQRFIYSTSKNAVAAAGQADTYAGRKLPGWVWFFWLMICFAAVWIEPKL
jgi:hypothetical protein